MKNKCPKCGFEYNEFDVFCARCGMKLSDNEFTEAKADRNTSFLKSKVDDIKVSHKDVKNRLSFAGKNVFADSLALNLVICMLVISLILCGIMYFVLNKHNKYKSELNYRNLMSNPANIPELKEPSNYKELVDNLKDVQNFLLIYLKYSNDSIEKKERIFIAYLDEINKLPHITNENMITDESDVCFKIKTTSKAKYCAVRLTKQFKNIGVMAFSNYNTIYLYPDNNFIKNNYSRYLSEPLKDYVNLKAKYNTPVGVGLDLYIKPKKLADKIYDFEKLFLSSDNAFVKEDAERILFDDFRRFIFTPSIYATTTQEMKKEFKSAYNYFIRCKKDSSLRPVVMSYLDKQRSYNEDNFKNDYPYKIFKDTFDENVVNNAFSDIFAELRKNLFSKNSEYGFSYSYNSVQARWIKYKTDLKLNVNDFIISEPDSNSTILIYNNTFSLVQELNISKFGRLFLVNGGLYVFNSDKLSISKIIYNGRQFSIQNLSSHDVTSIFPGIEVINIDSYSNYNIYLNKDNKKASYIILSRYSNGYSDYVLSPLKGNIQSSILPNMFTVDTLDDVLIAFHGSNVNPEETSEASPTYKFIVRTRGISNDYRDDKTDFAVYDKQTAQEEENNSQKYKPQFMPKIPTRKDLEVELRDDLMQTAPVQNIEPPSDDSED